MRYTDTPSPEVPYETLILEPLMLGVRQALSRQMLSGIHVVKGEVIMEHILDQIVFSLRAHVWADPRRDYKKTHKFTYMAAHPSWKHHLMASLPEGSFRRRWCHYFWEIPFDYANTRVTETIEVHVPTIFPENTMQYPDHLGRAHHPIQIINTGTLREPLYG